MLVPLVPLAALASGDQQAGVLILAVWGICSMYDSESSLFYILDHDYPCDFLFSYLIFPPSLEH